MSTPSAAGGKSDDDVIDPPPLEPLVIDRRLRRSIFRAKTPQRVIRLHGFDREHGVPWGPVYFSKEGKTRWDHSSGPGALCVGYSMGGVLLEYFGSRWPSAFSSRNPLARRFLTDEDMRETFRSFLTLPEGLRLLNLTHAGTLNVLGTDSLLLATHRYQHTREWGRWFGACEDLDGLIYSSRPAGANVRNVVLFQKPGLSKHLEESVADQASLWELKAHLMPAFRALQVTVTPPPIPPLP